MADSAERSRCLLSSELCAEIANGQFSTASGAPAEVSAWWPGRTQENGVSRLEMAPEGAFGPEPVEPEEQCRMSGDMPRSVDACFLDVLWQRIEIGFVGAT